MGRGARLAVVAAGAGLLAGCLFVPASNYAVGDFPTDVAVGDFNRDSKPDLAVTNGSGPNKLSILLNQGRGSFGAATHYTFSGIPFSPGAVAVGDFNADAAPDVVMTSTGSAVLPVSLNNGDGTFAPPGCCLIPEGEAVASDVAVGDFNADAKADMAVSASNVLVYTGNGDGTFAEPVPHGGVPSPRGVAVADPDGDAKPDLAVASLGLNAVAVLRGNGDGTFGSPVTYATGRSPRSVAVGDFDASGKPDLAVAHPSGLSVLLNQGDGAFGAAVSYPSGGSPAAVAVGEFNGDGVRDLTAANRPLDSNNVGVVLNRGDGTFHGPLTFPAGTEPTSVAVADLNADAKPDIAAANQQSDDVSVLLATSQSPPAFSTRRP